MKSVDLRRVGQTRWWWLILAVGILLVIGGFAYWFWPAAGYAVASQIFGWLLVMAGIVQLCVAAGPNSPRGWGWWIAGGIIERCVGDILSNLQQPYVGVLGRGYNLVGIHNLRPPLYGILHIRLA